MFEVRNEHGVICHMGDVRNFSTFTAAKEYAESLCERAERRSHYRVVEVKDVWTTSTLNDLKKQGAL